MNIQKICFKISKESEFYEKTKLSSKDIHESWLNEAIEEFVLKNTQFFIKSPFYPLDFSYEFPFLKKFEYANADGDIQIEFFACLDVLKKIDEICELFYLHWWSFSKNKKLVKSVMPFDIGNFNSFLDLKTVSSSIFKGTSPAVYGFDVKQEPIFIIACYLAKKSKYVKIKSIKSFLCELEKECVKRFSKQEYDKMCEAFEYEYYKLCGHLRQSKDKVCQIQEFLKSYERKKHAHFFRLIQKIIKIKGEKNVSKKRNK